MLKIDNKELKVIKQDIWVNNCTVNWVKGYEISVQLKFLNNKELGYLNLSAGFRESEDIKGFLNYEYKDIPYSGIDSEISFFEIYDTFKFLDTEIESEITLKLEGISDDDKVKANIALNDKLIKIEYEGYLNRNHRNIDK